MTLVEKIKVRARVHPQRIVLPEGEDPRVVSAAAAIAREGFAKITLLGRKQIIASVAADLKSTLGSVSVVDPAAGDRTEAYAQLYYERRRARGVSLDEARDVARRPLYFAALSVAAGDADGTVGGAANTSGETVRAALHAIGLAPDAKLVSSFFVMIIPERAGLELGPSGVLSLRRLRGCAGSEFRGTCRNCARRRGKCALDTRRGAARRAAFLFHQGLGDATRASTK